MLPPGHQPTQRQQAPPAVPTSSALPPPGTVPLASSSHGSTQGSVHASEPSRQIKQEELEELSITLGTMTVKAVDAQREPNDGTSIWLLFAICQVTDFTDSDMSDTSSNTDADQGDFYGALVRRKSRRPKPIPVRLQAEASKPQKRLSSLPYRGDLDIDALPAPSADPSGAQAPLSVALQAIPSASLQAQAPAQNRVLATPKLIPGLSQQHQQHLRSNTPVSAQGSSLATPQSHPQTSSQISGNPTNSGVPAISKLISGLSHQHQQRSEFNTPNVAHVPSSSTPQGHPQAPPQVQGDLTSSGVPATSKLISGLSHQHQQHPSSSTPSVARTPSSSTPQGRPQAPPQVQGDLTNSGVPATPKLISGLSRQHQQHIASSTPSVARIPSSSHPQGRLKAPSQVHSGVPAAPKPILASQTPLPSTLQAVQPRFQPPAVVQVQGASTQIESVPTSEMGGQCGLPVPTTSNHHVGEPARPNAPPTSAHHESTLPPTVSPPGNTSGQARAVKRKKVLVNQDIPPEEAIRVDKGKGREQPAIPLFNREAEHLRRDVDEDIDMDVPEEEISEIDLTELFATDPVAEELTLELQDIREKICKLFDPQNAYETVDLLKNVHQYQDLRAQRLEKLMRKYLGVLQKLANHKGIEDSEAPPAEDPETPNKNGKRNRQSEPVHRNPKYVKFQGQIRALVAHHQGRASAADPFPPCPSEQEIALHKAGKIPGPFVTPETRNLRLAVGGKWAKGPWNQQAALGIAQIYVTYDNAMIQDISQVQDAVLRHIPGLAAQYSNQLNPQNSIIVMGKASYGRRRGVVVNCADLIHLRDHINSLITNGHSDDEADRKDSEEVYNIKALPWRSKALTEFLRALDALHLSTHWTPAGQSTRGDFPRIRLANPLRISTSAKPVPNLPRCFYDETWLKTLLPHQLLKLNIKEVEVDLTLPPHLNE
ncbi:hypothetical protein EIP86_010977 [Pleurotus ostreatoroseus]|nr:hypothetical protein EIP86_010977 [Pleurotus ostreatoroseus]